MQHPEIASHESVALTACTVLARLRECGPRIHCITNTVAQNFTANVLLAAGCVPSMTASLDEVRSFVTGAQGLLVNLGTFDQERREAATIAIDTAIQHKLPWVLDPVFVDRVQPRAEFARELIGRRPTVIRLNHAEFFVLAGNKPSPGAAKTYARGNRTVIGLSGKNDVVTDGERVVSIGNGHPLMAKVTAIGCATSALVAACLSSELDALHATVAALVIVGVAGELAAERSTGPGTFAAAFIDCLYSLDGPILLARAQVC